MSLVYGLVGVLVGAALSWTFTYWHARKTERLRLTLSLYDDFHSSRMLDARITAHLYLVKDLEVVRPINFEEIPDPMDERARALSEILHFFDKVAVLDDRHLIEIELLRDLLGRYFRSWIEDYLRSSNVSFSETNPLKLSMDRLLTRVISRSLYEATAHEP